MHTAQFSLCLSKAARKVAGRRDELCKLDTFIGDGDHGITIERGFLAAADAARTFEGDLYALFSAVGAAMARTMGGAIGPLYAAFWSGVAAVCKDRSELQAKMFAQSITAGVEKVIRVGKANEGDKTMVDAMAPCARALMEAAANSESLANVAAFGAKAAAQGMQATRDMAARKGRARFLGEKSRGYIDPGAASFTMFLEALAEEIKTEEESKKP